MQDWQRVVNKYLEDDISPEERAQLENVLLADTSKMRDFANTLFVNERLIEVGDAAAVQLSDREGLAENGVVRRAFFVRRCSTWAGWAVAASIAAAAVIGWQATRDGSSNLAKEISTGRTDTPKVVQQEAAKHRSPVVPQARVAAYLSRTNNCKWSSAELSEGAVLSDGSRVSLTHGVAELIFDNGAHVTAQGPCDLVVDDSQTLTLVVGDVSIEATFGFKVVTPSGIVLDLGTEFGVSVNDRGGSEVHVFKGEVAFQAMNSNGNLYEKPLLLAADRACRYEIDGIALEEFEANEAKFDWRTSTMLRDSQVPSLPIQRDLILWLAADRFVELDESGRVERWRDLLVGGNSKAEDALQVESEHRPLLVADGINGHPAVQFGTGGTFLLTPPLETSNEQTAFVVCSLLDGAHDFQQIINYNGPPQRVVGPLGGFVRPAVFEICLRDHNRNSKFAICGEVFFGYTDNRQEVVKCVVQKVDFLQPNHPTVICFRYSLQDGLMKLFVDGRELSSSPATLPIAITSRKILGRHPILDSSRGSFHGRMGELLVFNSALTDGEIEQVSTYLLDRFDLDNQSTAN